jgi:hypothetical protein
MPLLLSNREDLTFWTDPDRLIPRKVRELRALPTPLFLHRQFPPLLTFFVKGLSMHFDHAIAGIWIESVKGEGEGEDQTMRYSRDIVTTNPSNRWDYQNSVKTDHHSLNFSLQIDHLPPQFNSETIRSIKDSPVRPFLIPWHTFRPYSSLSRGAINSSHLADQHLSFHATRSFRDMDRMQRQMFVRK